MQEQPTGETPEQALARELRGAQAEIRGVRSVLDDALAEDDRLAALAATPPNNTGQSSGGQGNAGLGDTGTSGAATGNVAQGNGVAGGSGQAEGGWR
ncbi:hypothetical protein [Kribbella sp. NPDC051620]|uniref:hypothetical protein n=1 Tax=Kribbella sp. NPDC051620 TaxID=3364120 RepID=UPI003788ADFE